MKFCSIPKVTSGVTWQAENGIRSNQFIKILRNLSQTFLETGWGRLWLQQIEMQIGHYWTQTSF